MNESIGYLLEKSMVEIWSERNEARRQEALERLYAPDVNFFEFERIFHGRPAIHERVGEFLAMWPTEFVFYFDQAARVNNHFVQLSWNFGVPGAPPAVSGMDIAVVKNNLISGLYLFLDTPPQGEPNPLK